VVYEASSWAEIENASVVGSAHVIKAINEKVYRCNRIEEKMQDMMLKEVLMVATDGEAIGKINGLSVLDFGDYPSGVLPVSPPAPSWVRRVWSTLKERPT